MNELAPAEDNQSKRPDAMPSIATVPGAAFYRRHVYDIRFISGEGIILSKLEQLSNAMIKVLAPDPERREVLAPVIAQVDEAKTLRDQNWDTMVEVAICRYVENYLVYLSELLGLLFRSNPEKLITRETVPIEDVLRHQTREKFVEWLADKRVNDLSYKGFQDIQTYFKERVEIEIVADVKFRHRLVKAIATRNLMVHRRGTIDDRYLSILKAEGFDESKLLLGQPINDLDHAEVMDSVLAGVKEVEQRAIGPYGLTVQPIDLQAWFDG
jgi:hypothetical protein